MKRAEGYTYGWLWATLWLMVTLSGCSFREMLDDYPVSGVQINFDWEGVTEKLPETMRVMFYPKDAEGRKVDGYLPAAGGEMKVPPGNYAVVVYNFNTESVQIRGEESYETIEAFTGPYTGLDAVIDMVWWPDPLYVVALDDVEIAKSDEALQMELKPTAVVKSYTFDIKVEGLERVSSVLCYVSNLNGSCFLGKHTCEVSKVPIHVDIERGDGVLRGHFASFVWPVSAETRVKMQMILTVKLVKRDNTVQEVEVDVTEVLTAPPSPPHEGEVEEPDAEIDIEIPIPDDKIVVDELEPGIDEGGGGIGGEVGGWGDETNVVLPV